MKAFNAGDYGECERQFEKLLALVAPLPQGSDAISHMGYSLYYRAQCRRKLGQTQEALADMQKSTDYLNHYCHWSDGTWVPYRDTYCKQAADGAEILAQWRKELAAGGKP